MNRKEIYIKKGFLIIQEKTIQIKRYIVRIYR